MAWNCQSFASSGDGIKAGCVGGRPGASRPPAPGSPSHTSLPRSPPGGLRAHAASPAGDTGSDVPLTRRSSPRGAPPVAERARPPEGTLRVRAPSPAPAAPPVPPDREPGAGPERRGLPGAHARSAAARRVHSRRSFQRPRARRRPALLKLASLQPSCHTPPHSLEQEETPL